LPSYSLFPYTTLFRSRRDRRDLGKMAGNTGPVAREVEFGGQGAMAGMGDSATRRRILVRCGEEAPCRVVACANFPAKRDRCLHQDRKSTRLNSSHLGI